MQKLAVANGGGGNYLLALGDSFHLDDAARPAFGVGAPSRFFLAGLRTSPNSSMALAMLPISNFSQWERLPSSHVFPQPQTNGAIQQ